MVTFAREWKTDVNYNCETFCSTHYIGLIKIMYKNIPKNYSRSTINITESLSNYVYVYALCAVACIIGKASSLVPWSDVHVQLLFNHAQAAIHIRSPTVLTVLHPHLCSPTVLTLGSVVMLDITCFSIVSYLVEN